MAHRQVKRKVVKVVKSAVAPERFTERHKVAVEFAVLVVSLIVGETILDLGKHHLNTPHEMIVRVNGGWWVS